MRMLFNFYLLCLLGSLAIRGNGAHSQEINAEGAINQYKLDSPQVCDSVSGDDLSHFFIEPVNQYIELKLFNYVFDEIDSTEPSTWPKVEVRESSNTYNKKYNTKQARQYEVYNIYEINKKYHIRCHNLKNRNSTDFYRKGESIEVLGKRYEIDSLMRSRSSVGYKKYGHVGPCSCFEFTFKQGTYIALFMRDYSLMPSSYTEYCLFLFKIENKTGKISPYFLGFQGPQDVSCFGQLNSDDDLEYIQKPSILPASNKLYAYSIQAGAIQMIPDKYLFYCTAYFPTQPSRVCIKQSKWFFNIPCK